MRRLAWTLTILVLAGCTARTAAGSPSSAPPSSADIATTSASGDASAPVSEQDAVLGPGGMTLRQEIGAVMMVGFKGSLTPAALNDWRQRQFGGLIVLSANHNASDQDGIRQLISSVRSVMAHPLLAAADQATATMPQRLKALGFDITVAPAANAPGVNAAIATIHAAGVYAAVQTSGNDKMPGLPAAIAAHADLVMVGQLVARAASISESAVRAVRSQLGAQGIVISNDLETNATGSVDAVPVAAVRFLENGGDMVIIGHDLNVADATYDAIDAGVLSGAYPRAELDASVQKLLNLGLRYMP